MGIYNKINHISKVTRLTESDLNRLVKKVIQEQSNTSQTGSDYFGVGFKKRPSSEFSEDFISLKPPTKPNLTCRIMCRKDRFDFCNPENGYQVHISFNRVVMEAEGFYTTTRKPGPLVELNKMMEYEYDMNGISKMTTYGVSEKEVRKIVGLYNQIKFQK